MNGNDNENSGPDLTKDPGTGPERNTAMNEGAAARRLERTHDGRVIGGVCSGFGKYLGVDPNILRIALAVFTLLGGSGVLVYALGWLLIPEEGQAQSIVQDLISKQQQKP